MDVICRPKKSLIILIYKFRISKEILVEFSISHGLGILTDKQ